MTRAVTRAVGRALEAGAKGEASDAVAALLALHPRRARRVVPAGGGCGDGGGEGDVEDVDSDGLMEGDVVEVRAGETAPCDGVVVEGQVDPPLPCPAR